MKRLLGCLLFLVVAVPTGAESGRAADRYADLLSAAQNGDAKAQNLVGLMLIKGEGVAAGPSAGHTWLHKAADQNFVPALRNLGVLHARGVDGVLIDYTEANAAMALAEAHSILGSGDSKLQPAAGTPGGVAAAAESLLDPEFDGATLGERVFQTYCAGCHGFDGIALFPPAPSFALGDRMYKDDPKLLRSVTFGKGGMPSWGDKIPEESIAKAIGYLRSLAIRNEYDLVTPVPEGRQVYFNFKPFGAGDRTWVAD